MLLPTILWAGSLLALASAQSDSDGFDIAEFNSLRPPQNVTIPSNLTAQVVVYDSDAATDDAVDSISSDNLSINLSGNVDAVSNVTATGVVHKRAATSCAVQPTGKGPIPSPDTASAFKAFSVISSSAASAATPSGYIQSFRNLKASNSAYGYLGFTNLDSYDTNTCASKCNAINGCLSFNIYFERDPTVDPGTNCKNPSSTTNIKCVFWGSPVTPANANNQGQWRSNFQVVIAGSNGYVNKTIDVADGYSEPSYYGAAAIDAPSDCSAGNTVLRTKVFTGIPFDVNLCSATCDAQTALGGTACEFFNTFLLLRNGVAIGQYCRLYSQAWPSSYATYTGVTSGSDVYTVDQSYGFSSLAYSGNAITGLVLQA